VDLQAAQALGMLQGEIASAGSQLQIVEARAAVRDTLRLEGLEDRVGRINRFTTVGDAVDNALGRNPGQAHPPSVTGSDEESQVNKPKH
jgi:hypothetical protein